MPLGSLIVTVANLCDIDDIDVRTVLRLHFVMPFLFRFVTAFGLALDSSYPVVLMNYFLSLLLSL